MTIAAAVLAALLATPVAAQSVDENRRRCNDPSDPAARISACTALIRDGVYTGSDRAPVFTNRGVAYSDQGQHALAIQDFDQSIRLDPSRPVAIGNRCLAHAVLGQLEKALADCQESLRLRPNHPGVMRNRGVVHLKAGRLDAAIVDFDAALSIVRDSIALYARGVARRRKGDAASGASDIAAAKAIQANIAEVMATYGVR